MQKSVSSGDARGIPWVQLVRNISKHLAWRGFHTKLILGNGKRLKEKLQRHPFPASFQWKFLVAKILVVSTVDNDTLVAACGIRSAFNLLTLYVREVYRGQGIGKQILKKTISAAQKRNLSFIFITVVFDNLLALRLYSDVGFRELVRLEEFGLVFMMLPLGTRGELAYTFLHSVCSKLPNTLLAHIADLGERMAIGTSGELVRISSISS